jgi:hypothetical protein
VFVSCSFVVGRRKSPVTITFRLARPLPFVDHPAVPSPSPLPSPCSYDRSPFSPSISLNSFSSSSSPAAASSLSSSLSSAVLREPSLASAEVGLAGSCAVVLVEVVSAANDDERVAAVGDEGDEASVS